MEIDEDDFEQPSSSDNNKAPKKRFEVKKVSCSQYLFRCKDFTNRILSSLFLFYFSGAPLHYGLGVCIHFLYNCDFAKCCLFFCFVIAV